MQRVRIKRMRENAVAPGYKHVGDSGFDLTACETVEIPPLQTRAVSLGGGIRDPRGLGDSDTPSERSQSGYACACHYWHRGQLLSR